MADGPKSGNSTKSFTEKLRNHWLRELIGLLAAIGGIIGAIWAIIQIHAYFNGPVSTRQVSPNSPYSTSASPHAKQSVVENLTNSTASDLTTNWEESLTNYLFTIENDSEYTVRCRFDFNSENWSYQYRLAPNSSEDYQFTDPPGNIGFNPAPEWEHGREIKTYMIDTFPVVGRHVMENDWTNAPRYYFQLAEDGEMEFFPCDCNKKIGE